MAKKEGPAQPDSSDAEAPEPVYVLRLFITGATPNSLRAVANTRRICEEHLKDTYTLEVIDVYQQPELAEQEQLVALPLLIRKKPLPERRLVGDLSDGEKAVKALVVRLS